MPELGKHTLTRYLGSDCSKQLKILLSSESGGASSERAQNGMPLKQKPLPGLRNITDAGDEWAATRLAELDAFIGPHVLVGTRQQTRTSGIEFAPTDLTPTSLASAVPGTFLAEFQFDVGTSFLSAFNFSLSAAAANRTGQSAPVLKELRPDLIEVRAPGSYDKAVDHLGDVAALATSDQRRQLRIIDIKLTSQPGPGYFAEVVYYSVALAGWLRDNNLDQDFVVSADPAIWPGSHEASSLKVAADQSTVQGTTLSATDCIEAVQDDLVTAPVPVFVSTLQTFFNDTLPTVIEAPWQSLPFHVSQKCKGCDFLGDNPDPSTPQNNALYCLQSAEATEHLSRIPNISRGASDLLSKAGTSTVTDVAITPAASPIYGSHHSLRAQRTVISARAAAITPAAQATHGVVPNTGTSGMLPKFTNLDIYVSADFDSSSAITLALGVTGFYSHPDAQDKRKHWTQNKVFVVDQRSPAIEEQRLIQFLEQIDEMIQYARSVDTARGATPSRSSQIQVYLWDELTYKHLCRVVGRHLPAILAKKNGVRALAWLFPADEVLQNERLVGQPVVSIVSDAIRSLVALPIPHHYSLLETARNYHPADMQAPYNEFRVPRLFEVFLSDQIPSERAHDIWNRGPDWTRRFTQLSTTVSVKLDALNKVTQRLRDDLKGTLRRDAARVAYLGAPDRVGSMTADELLLYAHARLDAAVSRQEVARDRAMASHEREARFVSMRLPQLLTGPARSDAIARLGINDDPTYSIYEVRPESLQAKFKEGDFTCAVVPENRTEILDHTVAKLVRDTGGDSASVGAEDYRTLVSDVLGATIVKFDPDLRLIVLTLDRFAGRDATRQALVADGRVDLTRNVSLEKVHRDFFTGKLKDALVAVGKTPKAVDADASTTALGQTPRPRAKARVPVEDVLWDAAAMAHERVTRDVSGARAILHASHRELNDSQWAAFEHALSHRLSMIWGPPGTGKSRTVVNIVVGAAWEARNSGRPLRVLVSSNTYTAIDNVLAHISSLCDSLVPGAAVYRGRSATRLGTLLPPVIDLVVNSRNPEADQVHLTQRLTGSGTDITIVGASPQQIHKFATAAGSAATPLFDLIVIDEAGQVDVANAILPLATLDEGGSVVVAGDPLQLPPIHQVEPPQNAAHMVGSIYDYLRERFDVASQDLLVNYRSNDEIVALARDADYPAALAAHSKGMRVDYATPLPVATTPPAGWPVDLAWSPVLTDLFDCNHPVTCVVYKDGLSGQSNPFEAQIVAGLAWLLDGRLSDQLVGELNPDGSLIPASRTAYTTPQLFETGLGVVTPHRAQQSEVVNVLHKTLGHMSKPDLREAVDTVERFQGQERDVIIATYAVGDPDTIADEDEFLLMLNRFNVMVSRAKAKIIVLVSDEVLRHLPTDIDVLRDSGLLKGFADIRCRHRRTVDLPYLDEAGVVQVKSVSVRTS